MKSVILSQTQISCPIVQPKIVKGYVNIPYNSKELHPASLRLAEFEFLDLELRILLGNNLQKVVVCIHDLAAPILYNQLCVTLFNLTSTWG